MSTEAAASIAEPSLEDKEKERKRELSRIRNRRYYAAHPERLKARREKTAEQNKAYQREWYRKNQAALKLKQRAYYRAHKDEVCAYQAKYQKKKRVDVTKRTAEWRKRKMQDPEYVKRRSKVCVDYINRRLKSDPVFRLTLRLRTRLREMIRRIGVSKSVSTMKLVGCDSATLKAHIESLFEPWMNWDNYGFGDGRWVIDHVAPLARFDHGDPEDLKLAWNFKNLRPLCWRRNMEKGASYK